MLRWWTQIQEILMGDYTIRLIVRALNYFWGPEPRLTPRSQRIARRSSSDYATQARLYYGDDQY